MCHCEFLNKRAMVHGGLIQDRRPLRGEECLVKLTKYICVGGTDKVNKGLIDRIEIFFNSQAHHAITIRL